MSEAVASDSVASQAAAVGEISSLTDDTWRSHVARAAKYPKSNTEYCRRHDLDLKEFRSHKRRFRTQLAKPQPGINAFVQVEAKEPVQRERLQSVEKNSMPDPRWVAEFVAALLSIHR
jgi:hypothetical protein